MRVSLSLLAVATTAAFLTGSPANAQVNVKLEEVVSGLTHPLAMVPFPDGSGRSAIVEQSGTIKILDDKGRLLPDPFLSMTGRIVTLHDFFDERGILGIAFHPNFKENGKVYVAYSAPLRSDELPKRLWWSHTNIVSEMQVYKTDKNKLDSNSERIISAIDWPQFNHNGHWIGFGPDGMLYVATGDGGYANDWGIGHTPATGNGQDLKDIHGKILRFDVSKADSIPADNPFVGRRDAEAAVWAYGLRNPWRCSFDMGGDKGLYCGDVGQNSWEEVDLITKGGNYGWRRMEGDHCFDYLQPDNHPASCDKTDLTEPIIVYANCDAVKQNCKGISNTGGYIYRGSYKAWDGAYIFGDWSKQFGAMDGRLFVATKGSDGKWALQDAKVQNMTTIPYILAFAQDDKGEVYALTSTSTGPVAGHDSIYRIVPAN
jgi:glucose/arabinose dehydrogenase